MKISYFDGKIWFYFSDGHEYHLAEIGQMVLEAILPWFS